MEQERGSERQVAGKYRCVRAHKDAMGDGGEGQIPGMGRPAAGVLPQKSGVGSNQIKAFCIFKNVFSGNWGNPDYRLYRELAPGQSQTLHG